MESVPPALIILFIILFAMLTFAGAMLTAQESFRVSWQAMEARQGEQILTRLVPRGGQVIEEGTRVEVTLTNEGTTRLTDFDQWDVIVEYDDAGEPASYHVAWLPYTEQTPGSGQWTVGGLYLDIERTIGERYEPGILNPGETLVLQIGVGAAIGPHTTSRVTLATAQGFSTSLLITRDDPPTLVTNAGMVVSSGHSRLISTALLAATDPDDPPGELTYTVITPPQRGSLNLGRTFTQAAIDGGLLSYAHDGGPEHADRFEFTLADKMHVMGPFVFEITLNQPPELILNAGLTLGVGETVTLGPGQLRAEDSDDPPTALIYTVTELPTQGSLSLTHFSQADIENGLLTYTHTGTESDQFMFTLTDGHAVLGPFTFPITVD